MSVFPLLCSELEGRRLDDNSAYGFYCSFSDLEQHWLFSVLGYDVRHPCSLIKWLYSLCSFDSIILDSHHILRKYLCYIRLLLLLKYYQFLISVAPMDTYQKIHEDE